MSTQRVFNVLVAEDESFQRLALLDILTLCDYEGIPIISFHTLLCSLSRREWAISL